MSWKTLFVPFDVKQFKIGDKKVPELKFAEPQTMSFAVTLCERDGTGKPTGRKKSYQTMNADNLCDWHEQNTSKGSKKKKNKNKDKAKKRRSSSKNKSRTPKRNNDG